MTEKPQGGDMRGTFLDWPFLMAMLGLVFIAIVTLDGAGNRVPGALLFIVGMAIWLARRGTFTPRDRP